MLKLLLNAVGVGCGVMLAVGALHGQNFPERPIRMLVAFAPGGNTDILARAVGARMTESWGRLVVVDNRPGGAGVLAAVIVAKASPDGHTLFVASTGELSINPSLFKNLPYDVQRDFAPVTLGTVSPLRIVVHPSFAGLRPLAISTARRSTHLPEVPTLQEQGVKDFDTSIWFAFVVPAKTPKSVIGKLNAEIGRILRNTDARDYLLSTGVEVAPTTPEELARFMKSEAEKYRKIIELSGTKAD